jgi:hypothetical protein
MKPEIWFSCSQKPVIRSYPEPDESSLHPPSPQFLRMNFNIIFLPAPIFLHIKFSDQNLRMHFSSIPILLHVRFNYSPWVYYCYSISADHSHNAVEEIRCQTLRSWVRISFEAWKSVRVSSVLVLSSVGRGFGDGLIPRLKSPTDCS